MIQEEYVNYLHEMLNGLLIFKIFYAIFIISFLNENFNKAKNNSQKEFSEFIQILYTYLIIAMNNLFRSFYLLFFLMIFNVIRRNLF